ncbi:MAG TPA: hypothetical protein DCO77_01315 [Nitrospiraceae bacterium]|nr:hypothetical protein [Nitrospiraceae bacterium]
MDDLPMIPDAVNCCFDGSSRVMSRCEDLHSDRKKAMKKYILLLSVLVMVSMLLYGCDPSLFQSPSSQYRPLSHKPRQYTEQDIKAKIMQLDKEFSTLGFKGLHLSMTHQQVNNLVKETPWRYYGAGALRTDEPQFYKHAFLRGDRSRMGRTWAKIGCEGPDGKGSCYWITKPYATFYDGKVAEIVLSSPRWSADKIDARVKDWGKFALAGLVKIYGKPTKVNKTFDQANIFSFKAGYDVSLYEWDKNGEQILITIGEYEAEFYCSVKFRDMVALKKLAAEKSKSKTEF